MLQSRLLVFLGRVALLSEAASVIELNGSWGGGRISDPRKSIISRKGQMFSGSTIDSGGPIEALTPGLFLASRQ